MLVGPLFPDFWKKVGIGGNYYGIEPYLGASAVDKAEKEELRKLRAKVATMQ